MMHWTNWKKWFSPIYDWEYTSPLTIDTPKPERNHTFHTGNMCGYLFDRIEYLENEIKKLKKRKDPK